MDTEKYWTELINYQMMKILKRLIKMIKLKNCKRNSMMLGNNLLMKLGGKHKLSKWKNLTSMIYREHSKFSTLLLSIKEKYSLNSF